MRVPKTSSESGGRSDADTGDTAEVAPEKEVLVRKTRASLDRQTRQSPPSVPPVLDVAGLGGVEVRAEQRLVLTDSHLSATDADTLLAGVVDPSKITFRISDITGGKLQSRLSSSDVWEDMTLVTDSVTSQEYYAFTFADLKAGNVAFLAGDGLQSGDGERIAFKVQAVDDDGNLSDSDDATSGDQAADGSVGVDGVEVAVTAGLGGPINKDDVLTPSTLSDWVGTASTHSGTLRLIVKLLKKQDGDVLSLETGYDASKITGLDWDDGTAELRLDFQSGTTAAEIGTALGMLWLDTSYSGSASERRVWVYPILRGVSNVLYRFDESAGLVRHYFLDSSSQSFADATTAASGRSLFGKSGYLGVYTSDTEKSIYTGFNQNNIFLAISDVATEGEWVITSGPRAGELFWDHGASRFGSGAQDPGWTSRGDFWHGTEPNGGNGGRNENYAKVDTNGRVYDIGGGNRRSVSHHDLWLSEGEIVARSVDVGKSPPNPVLKVDFGNVLVDNEEHLVLTEDHILVIDVDTVDVNDDLDASRITLRVSGVLGGTLQELSSDAPPVWQDMRLVTGQAYYAFTLADVRAGKIAFLAGDGVATADSGDGVKITFQIQAADDGPNLSDSDPNDGENDADPVDGEISIVVSTKLTAGRGGLVNGDGVLTPKEATLTDWIGTATTHGGTLRLIVRLPHKEDGDVLSLRGNYDTSKITPDWKDGTDGTAELWLDVQAGATEADIETALGTLWLETSASRSASTREIWVFPILEGVSSLLRYRFDESAGLVRHYFYDTTNLTFSAASTAAEGRTLFGKSGYLGVFTSEAEKTIYKALWQARMHVGITDVATEGKWVITAGPRQGQVLWDHTLSPKAFGPGAEGSGWSTRTDFWKGSEPDNWTGRSNSNPDGEDYATLYRTGLLVQDIFDGSRNSISHHDLWLSEGEIFVQRVSVAKTPPNPILEADFSGTQANSGQHLVLPENHILVKDIDTVLNDDTVDASRITLRVTIASGGTLHARASVSSSWVEMTKAADVNGAPYDYYAFTLADVRAGKIAFLAGNGVAQSKGGDGEKIVFQIQATDDDGYLSDSDPGTSDLDPMDGEISIVLSVEATTGYGALVNVDGVLTPVDTVLNDWKRSAESHGGTMRVVARIVDWQEGDELSLEGYGESKVTSRSNDDKRELFLDLAVGATVQDMREALLTLWLDSDPLDAASTREIWVFPAVAGVDDFAHRLDKSEKMVRYYYYDGTDRRFSAASTSASGRSLFGEEGYLGVYLSDAERAVYVDIRRGNIHLAVSDALAEDTMPDTWVITSGPRTGEVLWEHSTQKYGSGARGSGWGTLADFWDDQTTIRDLHDYAELSLSKTRATSGYGTISNTRHSITHFDLLLSKGAFLSRGVNLAESPPNPVLEVDFSSLLGTAGRTLMLHADHVLVKDPDTRESADKTKLDADKIKLRIAGISGGKLWSRSNTSSSWVEMTKVISQNYYAFTLADLRAGLVSFLPDKDATALVFTIQAADEGMPNDPSSSPHLSDSSFGDNNPDPINVSIPVVSLKEITAGKEMPVNDQEGLTPEDGTLRAWIAAATNDELVVLVRLEGAGSGDALFLEDGHGVTTITPSWNWDEDTAIGTLSLRSAGSATPAEFQTVLNKLALRTARFATARDATISLRPDVVSEVEKQDYYTRIVLLGASGSRPYIGEQQFFMLNFGKDDRAILPPYKFLVEDFDSSAEQITMVMSELSAGATLYKSDGSGGYDLVPAESDGSLEFTLKELQEGSMAIHLASPLGKEVSFELKAKDEADNWNDIDTSNANTEDARSLRLMRFWSLRPRSWRWTWRPVIKKPFPSAVWSR